MKKENIHFITDFGIHMETGDHHVLTTGLDVQAGTFDLSDKHGNHASKNLSYVRYTL